MIQSSLLGPVPWDPHPPSLSYQSEFVQPKEGIAVIERSTGRVIAGVAAPSQDELVYWLQDHPTFEVLRPSGLSCFNLFLKDCEPAYSVLNFCMVAKVDL